MHIDLNILSKHSNLAFEWFNQNFYCKANVNKHKILQSMRKWLFVQVKIFWIVRTQQKIIFWTFDDAGLDWSLLTSPSTAVSEVIHSPFKIFSLFIRILSEFFSKTLGKGMDEICKISWKNRNERTNESLLLENGTFKTRNIYRWHIFSKKLKKVVN